MCVLDVAAFLLDRMGPTGAMKLQKLVYYSQAWSLALLGRPLFQEEVQAWAYGPVVYELYAQHRGQFVVKHVEGDSSAIAVDPHAGELIQKVIDYYGRMDGAQLSRLTHDETPWISARDVPGDYPSQAVIGHVAMRDFYAARQPPWQQPPTVP